VLLVLLHDFPEFLCQYHFPLCDCIPPPCIQARHLQAVAVVISCTDSSAFCPDQLPSCLCASQVDSHLHPSVHTDIAALTVDSPEC